MDFYTLEAIMRSFLCYSIANIRSWWCCWLYWELLINRTYSGLVLILSIISNRIARSHRDTKGCYLMHCFTKIHTNINPYRWKALLYAKGLATRLIKIDKAIVAVMWFQIRSHYVASALKILLTRHWSACTRNEGVEEQ